MTYWFARYRRLRDEITSLRTLLDRKVHDETANKRIAQLLKEVSASAPIQAHEIGTGSKGEIKGNRDAWFWLFYSVMDRRANAATFIKAKHALQKERLFAPYKIAKSVDSKGESWAVRRIAKILKGYEFPLLRDHAIGELSFPKSIVDAARFLKDFNYDFKELYKYYVTANQSNLGQARDSMWSDVRKKIYGAGPRISSQFIRGMVLKGSWRFSLNDDRFLEKCRFNVWIAGSTRLCLVECEEKYYDQLGVFSDKHLNGNRGIVAHSLWFLRKRYCNRPPKCQECPLAGYCLRAYAVEGKGRR